ncbi:dTDP-4-dehydrorhamnose 3,5-epimerase [Treponema sp.]|uniref:dTDP-4-dehydrorhamnose 3,5-epimerase n=1 Tax=Treponema sp. TaxID=166 RepID=UPI00388F92AA
MSFTFTKCFTKDDFEFCGLYEIQPEIFGDSRGYFFESYSEKDFFAAGLTMKFVQDNQSKSSKGVLRGLHFQTIHPQGKLVRALSGKVYDVVVDLRSESATFGKYYGLILDASKNNMLYIPKGFAHGFLALTDDCIQSYKCTDFYHPEDECGLMWNDPKIGIDWESILLGITKTAILSEKDTKHAAFESNKKYFDMQGNWIGGSINS